MANPHQDFEKAQDDALRIVRGIRGVSVGIGLVADQQLGLVVNTERRLPTRIEARLNGLDVPVSINLVDPVHFDDT